MRRHTALEIQHTSLAQLNKLREREAEAKTKPAVLRVFENPRKKELLGFMASFYWQVFALANQMVPEEYKVQAEPLLEGEYAKAYKRIQNDVKASQVFLQWLRDNTSETGGLEQLINEIGPLDKLPMSAIVSRCVETLGREMAGNS